MPNYHRLQISIVDRVIDNRRTDPQLFAMAKVEIYTKAFCSYCARAMRLLGTKQVDVEEYDITLGGPKRAEMLARANGASTVPQIFINGQHVGGSDDLAMLDHSGKLDALLTS